jgi:hypothetical protein
MEVLLRVLLLLILSVFINSNSKTCEPIDDPEANMVFIRHNRSFSNAAKIANFFSNKGSNWVCARAC